MPVQANTGTDTARPSILLVFGTRPEAIKMAPVALELQAHTNELQTHLCATAQHRDMLDQALAVFGLKPDLDLNLMQARQSLTSLTARAVTALDKAMTLVQPNLVIVQGDTTSAMVAALVAYYHRVPVAHLEAGLRTGDLYQPFPEEANRRLISTLATLHFAPTPSAGRRLKREGISGRQIFITGNTVIDALLRIRRELRDEGGHAPACERRLVLLTMHRRESFGRPLEDICRAMLALLERNPNVDIVFPVHASPFVRQPVEHLLGNHPRIALHEPLNYRAFVQLLDACDLVLTDSGGVQEEAPALGKPVLVLRNKTERREAIKAGTAQLVGTNPRRVLQATETLLRDHVAYQAMAQARNPYGDGWSAQRVVAALRFYFGLSTERPAPFDPELKERVV
jgi:UDP-N-acetylglucosamine 2-epimerase (non-hydrolysing)